MAEIQCQHRIVGSIPVCQKLPRSIVEFFRKVQPLLCSGPSQREKEHTAFEGHAKITTPKWYAVDSPKKFTRDEEGSGNATFGNA